MALINCPECEAEVSDKAVVCPHCGYNLRKNDDCLQNKKSFTKNKFAIFAIGVMAISFIIIMIFGKAGSNSIYDEQGHIRGFVWGTSKDEIREFLINNKDEDPESSFNDQALFEIIKNFDGEKNLEASIGYSFDEDKLTAVMVKIDSTSEYEVDKLFDLFQKKLSKKYGEAKDLEITWLGSDIKTWDVEDSTILLILDDNYITINFVEK